VLGLRGDFSKSLKSEQISGHMETFELGGLFDWRYTGNTTDEFPGTMFRLPLRNKEQADNSSISEH